VITRTKKRQRFEGQISQISAQVEMITNSLAFVAQGSLVDVGLPVVIPVPRGFSIRPGEIVDVTFPTLSGMPSATAPRRQEMTKRP
jgi:hypothetical protein